MTDLPGRQELAARVRRYEIDGYELEDKIQEAYLCLLDPASDHNIERHMRRLQNASRCRKVRVARRNEPEFYRLGDELARDDAGLRAQENIEALTVLIAARSECDTAKDRETLELLAAGYSYGDLCREWRCWKWTARKRVSRFRKRIRLKVYEGEEIYF